METENKRLAQWSVTKRPPTPEALIGPPALKSQIKQAMTGKYHAILLTGPTGCGKTTIGRMIGYAVAKQPYGVPTTDYYETNIGSNGKIEDIRKLIEASRFLPSRKGIKKAFMLDEAHKLTPAAEDAFLKPLEEPPDHVCWLIATNEPERLKPVIVGRCYPIRVDLADAMELAQHLLNVLKENELRDWSSDDRKALVKAVVQAAGQIPRAALQLLAAACDAQADYRNVKDLIAGAVMSAPGIVLEQAANKILMAMILRYETGKNTLKPILRASTQHEAYALMRRLATLSNLLFLEAATEVQQPGTYLFNKDAKDFLPEHNITKLSPSAMGMIHSGMVRALLSVKDFSVDPKLILTDALHQLHTELKP